MNKQSEVTVEKLLKYNKEDAVAIGLLMPSLQESLSAEPMDESLLQDIIASPFHDQLVARLDGGIVGAATLSLLMGPATKRIAYLEDFVTDSSIQGRGVGSKLWDSMLEWCREKGATKLEFTSNSSRQVAHQFYLKRDCIVRDTVVFRKVIG